MNSNRATVAKASLVNLTALIIPLILALVTIPIYLGLVGEDRFGILTIVWLLLGYFGLFDLGLGKAAAQRLARMHECPQGQREEVFWTAALMSVTLGLFGSVLLFVSADWLFVEIFELSQPLLVEVHLAVPFLAVTLPIATGISMLAGSLQARQAFVALAVGQITGQTLSLVFPIVIASWGFVSIHYLIIATITGQLLGGIVLFVGVARFLPLTMRVRWSVEHARALLGYGGWVTISSVVGPLLTVVDRFVLAARLDMLAVTAYTVPYQVVTRISVLPASLVTALFPRFSMHDTEAAGLLMNHALLAITVVVTPLVILALVVLEPFLNVWVGNDLASRASPVGELLLIGVWFNALANVPFAYLQARGRPDVPAKFHLLELLPYIFVLWFLTDRFGIVGAAGAWTLRAAADSLLLYFTARRDSENIMQILQAIILVALTGGVVFISNIWNIHSAAGIPMAILAFVWAVHVAPDELWYVLAKFPLMAGLRFLRKAQRAGEKRLHG